jgi:hypothetical protein
MRWIFTFLALGGSLLLVRGADEKEATGSSKGAPPPFFLQDPTDSLCLAGEEFKRCSIDTLFYVVGSPGECISVLFCFVLFCFRLLGPSPT